MNEKIIISGTKVEVYSYSNLSLPKKKVEEKKTKTQTFKTDPVEARERQARKSRNYIRRLINSNFENTNSKFITLTYAENETDRKKCNRDFAKFVMRLKSRYPDLIYIAVPERQKRGAIHYHMICNLPYVKKAELAEMWGKGFVKINKIDECDNVGAYMSKYIAKAVEDKPKGAKAYLASRNVKKPLVLKDWDSDNIKRVKVIKSRLSAIQPKYENTYGNAEFTVKYKSYEIKELLRNSAEAIADEVATVLSLIDMIEEVR